MKKILIGALCVLSLGLFSACGSNNDKESGSGEKSKELTYWYWADNTDYSKKMQEIVKEFNDTNKSGVTVKAEEYPWDGGGYSQNLFTAAVGGGGPDMAAFKLTSAPSFERNNLLYDLTSDVNKWADKDDIDDNIYDIMKQATSQKDKMFVMPWNIQVLYVYYRPSLMEKAGIEVPKTYDEFLTACEKLTMDTNGDGKTDVYGFGMRGSTGGQEPWGSFIYGGGGDFDNLTSAGSIKGMEDYVNVYKKGYAPESAPADGFDQVVANFKSGRTAMTIHHSGSAAGMVETFGDDVAAFPFPKGEGKQWTSMGDTDNVIFEKCKNKEAAFEFTTFMATGKGQEMWCEATKNVPVSKRVQEFKTFTEDRFLKTSIEAIPSAGIVPITDTTTEWISTIWPNTVAQALSGDVTVKDAMKTLNGGLHGK